MDLFLLDWGLLGAHTLRLAIAYVLALPVAWDREQEERGAGLRTFPLVAIVSCGYLLMTDHVLVGSPEGQARLLEGLITGVGFIGGGAILKDGANVRGTATAASIWNTGAIGAAVALGRYEIALVLSVVNFITLRLLKPLKRNIKNDADKDKKTGDQPRDERRD